MTTWRAHRLRPGGVVRALGRLVLLIGFGFSTGLLIGILLEEPELLAGHLRGESETILLPSAGGDRAPVASLPVVAAPPAVQIASSAQGRQWAIQVGAFSDQASASRLAEDLGEKGYPTELLAASGDSQRWRVRVQPVRGKASANEIAARLKRIERLPTWVLPMEGSSP